MARRSGGGKARSGGAKPSLAQMGLFEMPDLDAIGNDDGSDEDVDEGDLEAELSALLSGRVQQKPKKPKPKPASDLASIQMMAAAALKDVGSGDESDDANLSDDPELMGELAALHPHQEEEPAPEPPPRVAPKPPGAVQVLPTSPSPASSASSPSGEMPLVETLQERLRMYSAAESAAKSLGDNSKARRYGRAIKTLESLLKKAKAGAPVSEEEIPPPVAIPKPSAPAASEVSHEHPKVAKLDRGHVAPDTPLSEPPAPPAEEPSGPATAPPVPARRPAPPIPTRPVPEPTPAAPAAPTGNPQEQLLATRRDQYKRAAINAKKRGDQQAAINYIRTAKQFDAVLTAMLQGQPVDLSKMPPPPPEFGGADQATAAPTAPHNVQTAEARKQASGDSTPMPSYIDENVEDDPALFGGPPPATTIMEALQQRLDKYKSTHTEAKEQGNDRKARRLERIVKQYEDAIKLHKAGKPVDFEELPAPPGFGPIPVPSTPAPKPEQEPPKPAPKPPAKPAPKPAVKPAAPQPGAAKPAAGAAQSGSGSPKKPLRRGLSTTIDKQMQFLLERQRLFREAALEAKRRGEVEQAKQYLRTMKGIEPMIHATECGLPIDASSIPIPPQMQEDFVVVEASDCEPKDENIEQVYETLEQELVAQHEMCIQNKDHFFKLGDVSSGTKFEKLAQDTNRDLLVVKNLRQRNDPLPRFHYETRVFSIVRCNHDLTDSDIEVAVVRGVNLPGKPDDLDSYVMVTFPFPNDAPQSARTRTVKDTNNPEFNETFKFEVNRKSRSLARVMKRHPIKCEVWAKRGFLRSDAVIGTASIKFEELENKCEIHDSYDVFDSKRPSGGKLEVKVRVREPFVSKQVEEIRHRWLIIGS
ncbi:lethal (2) giant discs 1 isoform X2 [Amblyomma americanum]